MSVEYFTRVQASAGDVHELFINAGLQSPQIAEKIGPGLALFARAQKP
jgi:hypothetical protein